MGGGLCTILLDLYCEVNYILSQWTYLMKRKGRVLTINSLLRADFRWFAFCLSVSVSVSFALFLYMFCVCVVFPSVYVSILVDTMFTDT